MGWLVSGVLLWAWSHLMKRVTPGFRARLGDARGKGLVAVLSLMALGLMILGYRTAAVTPLWQVPQGLRVPALALMVLAVFLVNLGQSRGVMRRWLRHPMLTAVVLWAVAHLMVKGDLASVVLFGGILAWALADMIAINRMEPAWQRPAAGALGHDAVYLAVSTLLLAGIVWLHGWLGPSVLS
jgi:uncharacterized membrane protein